MKFAAPSMARCQAVFQQPVILGLVVAVFFSFSACAGIPTMEPTVSMDETKTLFKSAKLQGAAVKSPYEFYAAEMYLNQAIKEYERGYNSVADLYLNKANEKAAAAYQNATRFKKIKLK